MKHHDFLGRVDDFLDGTLDRAEYTELIHHKRGCRRCSRALARRRLERLAQGLPFHEPSPQECLSDDTLRRWFIFDLPPHLRDLVDTHLETCSECHARMRQVAEREEAKASARLRTRVRQDRAVCGIQFPAARLAGRSDARRSGSPSVQK